MRFSDFFAWPAQRWQRDGGLCVEQWVYCERIICIYDEYAERGWWHDLEDSGELLFSQGGRIVESSIADLGVRVEEAVEQGYRPVLFVDGMRNCALAANALGRHEAFGNIYVMGRDDELMSDLLHRPSDVIQAVARDRGRISVPTLNYGKALDGYFAVELDDFHITGLETQDALLPKVELVCRLNPYRYIDVSLLCKEGTARLEQKYRTKSTSLGDDEPCDYPVRFEKWSFDFGSSNPLNTEDVVDDSLAFLQAFTEKFELPLAYKGWDPGGEPPWFVLVQRLRSMSRGTVEQLTAAQQALLALVDEESLSGALPVRTRGSGGLPVPVRGVLEFERDSAGNDAMLSNPNPFPLLIPLVDDAGSALGGETIFGVKWLFAAPPSEAPVIVNAESGETIYAEWRDDLQRVALPGVVVDTTEIGWAWCSEHHRLKLLLRSEN